jgi:hypothetical protein
MGSRTGLVDLEERIQPGLELRPFGRPACSQSLYRLPYTGSLVTRGNLNVIEIVFKVHLLSHRNMPCMGAVRIIFRVGGDNICLQIFILSV